ncbi:formin-like protein 3 [Eurytemora carolleeae]|uniref:formin-like protein 3 n=1 Tax=Eurytemora carolleeae TaxID=1294199 RepID=UPI000C76888E|nr:formin-like protein 3 [Eurytemora carolleeae]|eukprot:XP_023319597.1 formin-like protein 3 [Eurytemora affinis]
MPRRTTRRKPKLPTPPCSPNISVLGRGTCSTPSPPPPPLPEIDLITTSEPLPPPPPLTAAKFSRQNGIIPAPAGPQFVFQPASSKGGIRNSSYAPGTAGTAAVAGSVGTAVSPYGRSSTARQTVNHQHQQQSFNRQPSTSAQQLQTTARQPTTPPKQSHSVGRQPANTPPQLQGDSQHIIIS